VLAELDDAFLDLLCEWRVASRAIYGLGHRGRWSRHSIGGGGGGDRGCDGANEFMAAGAFEEVKW
jgi:hypothetical protein